MTKAATGDERVSFRIATEGDLPRFARWPVAVIGPEPANERAIRAYERAGFRWFKTVRVEADDPGDTGDEHLMGQTRLEFERRSDRVTSTRWTC